MGSKDKISKEIKEIIDLNRTSSKQAYVEPMCGGCNMIDKMKGKRIAGDNNKYLIALWKGLQLDLKRPYEIPKDLYNKAKKDYKNGTNTNFNDFLIGWIGFMASFNGKFFDAGYGGITEKRNYIDEQIRNTEAQIKNIKGIDFYFTDYQNLLIPENSIIYFDIPYFDSTKYTTNTFDYPIFYDFAELKSKQGHKVFISEYWMPEERFTKVWQKQVKSNLSTRTQTKIECLFIPKNQIINQNATLF